MVIDCSGFGDNNDDSAWDDLITKNPACARFCDGSTFVDYDDMFDALGNILFDGKSMTSAGSLVH